MMRVYAGLWTRILAFGFDYLPIAIYLVVMVMLGLVLGAAFPELQQVVFGNPVFGQIAGFFIVTVPISLYFVLFESSAWQATWGKRKRHLQVISADGARLSKKRSISRTVLKFIPWELAHTCIWQISFADQTTSPIITFGFILVWILVGANAISLLVSPGHQTLYDRLANTYVIKIMA